MPKKKNKKRNKKNLSKRTSWNNFEKYIERVFKWSYISGTNRYDRSKKQKNKLPKHIITKENTMKGYMSQVKQYCKWVYEKKGETNFRFYKKSWYEEYLEEQQGLNTTDQSVWSLFTQISALTKFENILEAKWKEDKGERIQFGIIADKRVRRNLKENKVYRSIEDMKKSRPIWSDDDFLAIENELDGEHKKLWRFLGATGLRLESALQLRKKDIYEDHIHIEHGKAGKRSDVHLLNPFLLKNMPKSMSDYTSSVATSLNKLDDYYSGYKEDRRLFDNFKKEVTKEGHIMKVDKKLSTIKSEFERAVSRAGTKLGINNVTPHSARKYYCNSVYQYINRMDEDSINGYLKNKHEKYESIFRKELMRINSKLKLPKNFDRETTRLKSLKTFDDVLNYFTREQKAALISSCESSHNRISIMAFYINRKNGRKRLGANIW